VGIKENKQCGQRGNKAIGAFAFVSLLLGFQV